MKIAVIIATFNRCKLLEVLLSQINGLIVPEGVSLKIIVINDGSTDNTLHMLRTDFPQVTIINGSGDWWWTKCMNEGFKKAIELGYNYVIVMNDDGEIEINYLNILINDYKTLPVNSILGSASVSIDNYKTIESSGTCKFNKLLLKFTPYHNSSALMNKMNFNGIHSSYTLSGRGTIIPTVLFNRIGFYDEKLIQYGSDDDFTFSANKNSIPVYISWNAIIYNHTQLTSSGASYKKENFVSYFNSFFNQYSINSLKKAAYLYSKHGFKLLTPLYLFYFVTGSFYAKYFKKKL